MSKDETDRLERMEKTLDRLASAVMGDEGAGHLGLVARTNNHAGRIKRLENWRLYIAGGLAVVALGYKLIVDWWPHK